MFRWMDQECRWVAGLLGMVAMLVSLAFGPGLAAATDDALWVAPGAARQSKNPVPVNAQSLAAGEATFRENCVACHGEKGMGDGDTGKLLKKKPTDFTDKALMRTETDGSLFWKISEGKSPMPSWKDELTEKERWQLVNYIRKLGKDADAAKAPASK